MAALPDVPKGRELEDFFAAILQATGHYVEKNIENTHLELDVVATRYSGDGAHTSLVEIKGTDARFGDLFKLVGHMAYLHIRDGAFVTTEAPRDRELDTFSSVATDCGVRFILVDDLSRAGEVFEENGYGTADALAHAVWRFSFWIERIYLQTIRALRPTSALARTANDHYMLVNSGVFSTRDPIDKVAMLYSAYTEHPRLTAELADELAGDDAKGALMLSAALLKCQHPALHAAMYFEQRARLSILKAACDYLRGPRKHGQLREGKLMVDFRLADLPQSFLSALDWLEKQPKFWLYPVFWQNYLWGWGGLLPDEHRSTVLGDIAVIAGLMLEEAEMALHAFDELFPIDGGWHHHFSNADYQFVKMTPAAFQGLGAFHQLRRAGLSRYDEYLKSGRYTASDFAQKNNAAVALLPPQE